jgi:spore maturation protein CgeB
MRVAIFTHSLVSDWNHGNAHFVRGVTSELLARGHDVRVYEPADGWSRRSLLQREGNAPIRDFQRAFPGLGSIVYDPARLDPARELAGCDLVLVHEWNDHDLVRRLGALRHRRGGFRLLFHDTHHRSVTAPETMAAYDLRHYDGVLAYGRAIRDIYLERGWADRAWTWHEAADVRVFHPVLARGRRGELAWIGNWGDGERSDELRRFLLGPAERLGLTGSVFGVRYPAEAREAFSRTRLRYRGWIANHRVPAVFGEHRVTVHIPRRPYVQALPGIPTIRPFEAMACGIPLICSPWEDSEGLFTPGSDYLVARDGEEMEGQLAAVLSNPELAASLSRHGLRTILSRHTCGHRVDELLSIAEEIGVDTTATDPTAAAEGI